MSARPSTGGTQVFLGTPPWEDPQSMRHYYVEREFPIERIVAEVCDGQIDERELRAQLSAFDLLDPWDDPEWLREAYREQSAPEIAADLPVTSETIRQRLHAFDLMDAESRGSSSNTSVARERLLEMDPDEIGEPIPEGDDSFRAIADGGRR